MRLYSTFTSRCFWTLQAEPNLRLFWLQPTAVSLLKKFGAREGARWFCGRKKYNYPMSPRPACLWLSFILQLHTYTSIWKKPLHQATLLHLSTFDLLIRKTISFQLNWRHGLRKESISPPKISRDTRVLHCSYSFLPSSLFTRHLLPIHTTAKFVHSP